MSDGASQGGIQLNRLERPPSEIARRKWQQAKAAASAGAEAWRSGPQTRS